jgi:hypothetical protein
MALPTIMEDINESLRVDRRHLIGGAAAVAAGVALGPLPGTRWVGAQDTGPGVEPFSVAGACTYVALDPYRICDTRPELGPNDYQVVNARVIRVPVVNRGGAPANARAAVLNVTAINRGNPAYVTVYPADTLMPTASNINLGPQGVPVPNLVTVMLGGGGDVMVYVDGTADIIVDLAGVYVPASGPASAGRMEVRPTAVRVVDTRNRGSRCPPTAWSTWSSTTSCRRMRRAPRSTSPPPKPNERASSRPIRSASTVPMPRT